MNKKASDRSPGIYQITNKVTGKKYIGSSVNAPWRVEMHRRALIRGNHEGKGLQADFNNYTPDDFTFEIIETTNLDEKELTQRELYYTALAHDSEGGCYNRETGVPRRNTGNSKTCSVCGGPHYALGYCSRHWAAYRKGREFRP